MKSPFIFNMSLHKFERIHLQSLQRDLESCIKWIDEILERDNLHCDDTLIDAAVPDACRASPEDEYMARPGSRSHAVLTSTTFVPTQE